MKFPDKFIRGVSSPNFVDSNGRASAEIFHFTDNNRDDGFSEASINWYDDDDALTLLLQQRKDNDNQDYQFKYGAAILERSEADKIMKHPLYCDVFSYERSPLYDNKYHGNLLRKDTELKKQYKNMIASALAMFAQLVPRTTTPAK